MHPDAGLTTGDADEAAMKRALARRAADTYVLASAEKIGAASPFAVLPLDEVAGIVTDADPQHPVLAELQRSGRAGLVVGIASRPQASSSPEGNQQ